MSNSLPIVTVITGGPARAGRRAYHGVSVSGATGGYDVAMPTAMPPAEARDAARLFAASPMMVEVLRDAVESWSAEMASDDGIDGSDMVAWFCSWFASAEAALAAATGEAQ